MDSKDLQEIFRFIEKFKNEGRTSPQYQRIHTKLKEARTVTIEDSPELQMNICSLIASLRSVNELDLAMKTFSELPTTQGAIEFLLSFVTELGNKNPTTQDFYGTIHKPLDKPIRQPVAVIGLNNLHEIRSHLRAFKKELRNLIKQRTNISVMAKDIGIPQSSLSRILNSDNLPRRSTIIKIFEALRIKEIEIFSA